MLVVILRNFSNQYSHNFQLQRFSAKLHSITMDSYSSFENRADVSASSLFTYLAQQLLSKQDGTSGVAVLFFFAVTVKADVGMTCHSASI